MPSIINTRNMVDIFLLRARKMTDYDISNDWNSSDWGNDIPFSIEQNTCHELALQIEEMSKVTLIMKIESILIHVEQMCLSCAFKKWSSPENQEP